MLHHLSRGRDYWFCTNCREEMPNLEAVRRSHRHSHHQKRILTLSVGLDLSQNMALV